MPVDMGTTQRELAIIYVWDVVIDAWKAGDIERAQMKERLLTIIENMEDEEFDDRS